jgi:hypothetical protein
LEDEDIIMASTLIAIENKPGLKVRELYDYVYRLSRDIGMTKFSRPNFSQVFIPLTIPVLTKAGLIQTAKKGPNLVYAYAHAYEINLDTICRLTDMSSKKIKKIRRGSKVRSRDAYQKKVFDNIYTIINGHIDDTYEQDSFKRHIEKGMNLPAV